ncbi:tetratricopeptide repeat protein [Yoonia vestfoldensis]|uniref:tetratricopeptide repeat protein n=1 Tax=Yoonia vestfoldensis TaxID=245188 RepID=UPI00037C2FE0|nr:tetratricopeptide repeat protein [Yoonia vestfoldensis]
MRRVAIIAGVLAILHPASGWAQDTGAQAFARNDLAAARALWRDEAAAGSAEAMLGLGLLADRGTGGARDPEAAFDWYAQAAALGLAEAQFNLAIIHDAGTDRPRDVDAAILWYTRAALRDHARAQFNLGLLYEAGDGIAANPALAQYWFDKAAMAIPAAAAKALPPQPAIGVTAPDLLFAQGGEVVWTIAEASSPTFLVEALRLPRGTDNYAAPEIAVVTAGSGLLLDAGDDADVLWRVSSLAPNGTNYAPSAWAGADGIVPPAGRVTLIANPSSPAMRSAAEVFATDLRHAGYWVRLDARAPQEGEAYISYGFAADQPIAAKLAAYLPTLTGITPVKQSLNSTAPGEVIVNLAAFR